MRSLRATILFTAVVVATVLLSGCRDTASTAEPYAVELSNTDTPSGASISVGLDTDTIDPTETVLAEITVIWHDGDRVEIIEPTLSDPDATLEITKTGPIEYNDGVFSQRSEWTIAPFLAGEITLTDAGLRIDSAEHGRRILRLAPTTITVTSLLAPDDDGELEAAAGFRAVHEPENGNAGLVLMIGAGCLVVFAAVAIGVLGTKARETEDDRTDPIEVLELSVALGTIDPLTLGSVHASMIELAKRDDRVAPEIDVIEAARFGGEDDESRIRASIERALSHAGGRG